MKQRRRRSDFDSYAMLVKGAADAAAGGRCQPLSHDVCIDDDDDDDEENDDDEDDDEDEAYSNQPAVRLSGEIFRLYQSG
ncbi:GH13797 [Drosophila grimshawi]|uniref:GH13797 n=1 Tax=Drosophila grimshawi TaxID=7222 RepID=B4JR10_DROGR|nr:GH13797 [Drosophila grimshawi]